MKLAFIPMLPTLYGRRYQMAKHLAAEHEVHFLAWDMPYPVTATSLKNSLYHSRETRDWEQDGIYIHKVRRWPFFFPPANRPLFARQLRELVQAHGIQAVISQSFFNETEPPTDIPLYFDYNDDYPAFARIYGSRAYKLAYKLLAVESTVRSQLSRARAVFAVSDILVAKARQYNSRVFKIPNGVDIESIQSLTPQRPPDYGTHSIAYVSTFGKWSQIVAVIQVVAKIRRTLPDIQLYLIGNGTELPAARSEVIKLGLQGQVKFFGHVADRHKIFEIINACAICLNISDKNDFRDAASPIKVLEYSALGKTIVSTNLAEVTRLGFQNVLVFEDDPGHQNLQVAIERAFALPVDASGIASSVRRDYSWNRLSREVSRAIMTSEA